MILYPSITMLLPFILPHGKNFALLFSETAFASTALERRCLASSSSL